MSAVLQVAHVKTVAQTCGCYEYIRTPAKDPENLPISLAKRSVQESLFFKMNAAKTLPVI
jgi:hypothetical protein